MPRIAIPVDRIPRNGVAVVPVGVAANATDDHDVENAGSMILLFENKGATTCAATVVSVKDAYGRVGDVALTVPVIAGAVPGKLAIGPFSPPNWNIGGGSRMYVDCTGTVTDLRIYALVFARY